jgi:hypothetical protein
VKETLEEALPEVLGGFLSSAYSAELLAGFNEDVLWRYAEEAVAQVSQNDELAQDVLSDLKNRLSDPEEVWRDLHVNVALLPNPATTEVFEVHFTASYRTTLRRTQMAFVLGTDVESYDRNIASPEVDVTWGCPSLSDHVDLEQLFRVEVVRIEGHQMNLTRNGQITIATSEILSELVGTDVEISYNFVAPAKRRGHILHLEVPRICKNAEYAIALNNCGVTRVRVVDYFSSRNRATIRCQPSWDAPTSVTATLQGWITPRSGMAFVWTLEDEVDVPVLPSATPAGNHGAESEVKEATATQ